MNVENKKAVRTDPGGKHAAHCVCDMQPHAGSESDLTAFLLAFHFQQCSQCINGSQRMSRPYEKKVVGGSHEAVAVRTTPLRGCNGANPLLHQHGWGLLHPP